MTTCCPNCPSAVALGTEAASICTECATATIAGAAFNLPLLLAGALVAGVAMIAFRVFWRTTSGLAYVRRAVLG